MNNDIYLKDILDVSDNIGPKGYVVITDENGKVLVRKHNMIVKGGKNYIFDAFYNNFFNRSSGVAVVGDGSSSTDSSINIPDIPSDSDLISSSTYALKYIRFGNNSAVTEFTDRYVPTSSSSQRYLAEIDIMKSGGVAGTGENTYNFTNTISAGMSNNHPYISIGTELLFNQSMDIASLSEIELILDKKGGSNDENDRKLFSRVTFDKIPVTAGATFNLIYYIYF